MSQTTPPYQQMLADIDTTLIDAETLTARIAELGAEISAMYADVVAAGEHLLLVGVLKGGAMFLVDLARQISLPVMFDFMAVSSYGAATTSSGVVRILKDLDSEVSGKHVLIVEDIIDTGLTLAYLLDYFKGQNPASIRLCTLLSKPERHKVQIPIDFLGFEIPDRFVVGYGLDYSERYRNLPFIGVLKESVYRT